MTTLRCAALAAAALALALLPSSAGAQQTPTSGAADAEGATDGFDEEGEPALIETAPPLEPEPAALPGVFVAGDLQIRPLLQSRSRVELRLDPLLGAHDLYFVTMRNRLGVDASIDLLRVVVQVQDARDFGVVDPTASTGATTDIHQGYLQVGGDDLYLRLGRQEITWASQRFLGALDWSSPARSFDALRGRWGDGFFAFDAFGAWVRASRAIVDPRTGTAAQTEGDWLAGISGSVALAPVGRLGIYALYRHDGPTEAPGTLTDPTQVSGYVERRRDVVSPGVRLESEGAGPLRYELEVVAQLGRVQDREHVAFGAAGEVHYRFQGVALGPSIGGGASYGSGDGGDLSELDNFYPTNHARYGSADLIGLRNQAHGFVRAGIAPPGTNLEAWADVHVLALAEPGGRWSDAGGRTIAHDPTNTERLLGTEVDLELRWRPESRVALWGGYAVFAPGPAAARLGRDQITHWAYLMLGVVLP